MSQHKKVIEFFQTACEDRKLQDRLKPPCPPTRQGFASVAKETGYDLDGKDIDDYVRFYQFYEEFQEAIDRHQAGGEPLADWLNQWQKHLQHFDSNPTDDREETIKRFI